MFYACHLHDSLCDNKETIFQDHKFIFFALGAVPDLCSFQIIGFWFQIIGFWL